MKMSEIIKGTLQAVGRIIRLRRFFGRIIKSPSRFTDTFAREWIARGFNDSLEKQFEEVIKRLTNRSSILTQSTYIEGNFIGGDPKIEAPWWLGYDKLHRSHRSNLVRKDPSYYRAYFTESGDLPYYWPSEERSSAQFVRISKQRKENLQNDKSGMILFIE